MKAPAQCRPRTQVEEPEAYPFTGNDDDADACKIMLDLGIAIVEGAAPKHRQQPLGEFLSKEQLEAVAILNHAVAYLDNRTEYPKMADELRGYLVIE